MTDDIRELLAAVPFRPFQILMNPSGSFVVSRPTDVVVSDHGETIHHTSPEWGDVILSVRHIARVKLLGAPR